MPRLIKLVLVCLLALGWFVWPSRATAGPCTPPSGAPSACTNIPVDLAGPGYGVGEGWIVAHLPNGIFLCVEVEQVYVEPTASPLTAWAGIPHPCLF